MNEHATNRVKVLVADDHPLIRQGIRMALADEPDLFVVGEAADGVEVLQNIAFLKPDVVVLDLDMPKLDGLSVVRELKRLQSSVGVVILTLHTGADLLYEALHLGIRGYILKSSAVTDVAEGVRRVASGETYLSETVRQAAQKGKAGNPVPEDLQRLTPLEMELVRKVARGQTSREIAASLNLSDRTVENYRTAICTKLELSGPNALLRYALSRRANLLS